ncbi:MAG: FAD-dependent oxidoreductase [Chloroflexi bacterium]|nr:FAD-dependent oxidoreductase [Chloroflexota bacterium]
MTVDPEKHYLVGVIGAGPAGLYAAQHLARKGVQVVLFNRDIKPGGLAEYGIFPDKIKMRDGLKAQFKRILALPNVHYQGNVSIGQSGDLQLDQLRKVGFQAFMITTGAQQNNWLGLPGEDLAGVYHANEIAFHYNHMPEYADLALEFGQQVVVIGAGNVMLDIVNYLKCEQHACVVTAYARRGPGEVKFDPQTLESVANCLDVKAVEEAVKAAQPLVAGVGGDPRAICALIKQAQHRAGGCDSGLRFRLAFLRSPKRLIGDSKGRAKAITFEVNELVREGELIRARGTGALETVPADTVIFSIGSQVDPGFGLPVSAGNYVTTPYPRFPVHGISYEVYNPDLCSHCEDLFVSGWARLASEGIVGLARKDAERGAQALLHYLETLVPTATGTVDQALLRLPKTDKRVVALSDLETLWAVEEKKAEELGLWAFKFKTNQEMLAVIEKASKA